MDEPVVPDVPDGEILQTRGYQREMLEASLLRNTIIALDTGSGKTHIAVLRMKIEAQREAKKVSWFLAPTVTLCKQQHTVISTAIPVSVGLINGSLEPEQWKDHTLWARVLETHRIVVSTPQVLLDALRHGYVNMGRDLALLVFDECHHAVDHHPYSDIMSEFYRHLPTTKTETSARPMILGLTASPIYGGHVEMKFQQLEWNLDSVIRAPEANREELEKHVHRPSFQHKLFKGPDYFNLPTSHNLSALRKVIQGLNIEQDPYILDLRRQLGKMPEGPQKARKDQLLSKALRSGNTFTHKGLKDLDRSAYDICIDLGPWAADWYISEVLTLAQSTSKKMEDIVSVWQNKEKAYLLGLLAQIDTQPVSYELEDIRAGASEKFHALVKTLLEEKDNSEAANESYSGLVFVTKRDSVLALSEMLSRFPETAEVFSVGSLLGTSSSSYRAAFVDITRALLKQSAEDTLQDFKIGEKNLIVATSVAEEGIDIQACGSVIGWDLPSNMVSFAQRRGRARQKRSTFVLLFEDSTVDESAFKNWEKIEFDMVQAYRDRQGDRVSSHVPEPVVEEVFEDGLELRDDSTGALMTLQSVIPHLMHFCAVLPNAGHIEHRPLFEVDPPEFVEGWHTLPLVNRQAFQPYTGPYGCKIILPMLLAPELRQFSVEREFKTKVSAFRHAAFKAYAALKEVGLLNNHLLPLSSAMDEETDEEVQKLLQDIEKRAGTASVTAQLDPWRTESPSSNKWWLTRISTSGNVFEFLSRAKPLTHPGDPGPLLYHPQHGELRFDLVVGGEEEAPDAMLEQARAYTQRLFWAIHGSRMVWNNKDYAYLFLPRPVDATWAARMKWLEGRDVIPGVPFAASADAFGTQFSFPEDLVIVRLAGREGKLYQFIRWRFENLTPEEEEEVRGIHRHISSPEITYPILVVRLLHPRQNFLVPCPPNPTGGPSKDLLLLAKHSTIDVLPPADVELALLAPSLIHSIARITTLNSLRKELFVDNPRLCDIPSSLLITAITSGSTGDLTNYQRLETLGDTVLKLTTSVQLLAEYPLWHEGYLAKRKDHAVSNVRLAKDAIKRGLYRWIIRDRFAPKRWKPLLQGQALETAVDEQRLSTKVLADVVESLIGAAYVHGGFPLAIECIQFFELGLSFPWKELPTCVDLVLSRVIPDQDSTFPLQLTDAEQILGYTFKRKMLLVEALTHSSHQISQHETISYERSEFLGDAVLDMVVTEMLYNAPGKNYGPGQIHLRRSALVNAHHLAYVCMASTITLDASMPRLADRAHTFQIENYSHEIYLWQCLLHSSQRVLEDQNMSLARFKHVREDIKQALKSGTIFPWAGLTRIQAPKFFSDIIESLIGAVFLDSDGDFGVVHDLLKRLGILPLLERVIIDNVEVFHPVSRLHNWGQRGGLEKKIEYVFNKEKGRISCTITVDGVEISRAEEQHRGKMSAEEVKLAAAEQALRKIELDE